MTDENVFLEKLRSFVGRPIGEPFVARDPVNVPMIRHWCDAMGDRNPVYLDEELAAKSRFGGIVAPPTMLQAWTMKGLTTEGPPQAGGLHPGLRDTLDDAGFTSVVATNSEQEYERYLRPGDVITGTTVIESVSEEKKTGLGPGHFIESLITWTDGSGEVVGRQRFRLLKFKPPPKSEQAPAGKAAPPRRPRPAISDDTRFFWEGVARSELLIQKCASCGALRHPPRPMCGRCRSLEWETVRASGNGTVYSYVVHHYPPVPGFDPPFVVALIELEEGVRIVSNLVGVERATIGMPVRVRYERVDDDLTVPLFEPGSAHGA